MGAHIWEVITQSITNFVTALTSAVNGVVPIFYNTETGMTFVGYLLLIAVGLGIVYFAFNLIRSLVRRV